MIKILRTTVINIGTTHYGVMWINDKFLGVFKYNSFTDYKEWICPWRQREYWFANMSVRPRKRRLSVVDSPKLP